MPRGLAALIGVAALAWGWAGPGLAAELPRARVDTALPPAPRRTIAVPAGADLQAALHRAAPGDAIALEPGAVYTGPFTLPRKTGEGWIVIRTAAPDEALAPPGRRVGPEHARAMPKLIASSGAVISAAPGAHHYRFIGIEIRPREGVFLHNLVDLGGSAASVDALPHHIVFDRCFLHGDPAKGARRGIALNARDAAVVDSHLSDFKEAGADSQAIAGWGGPGPFAIVNNYLEAAGENLLFGGADPSIRDLVPADIEIRHNHLAKPLAWKAGEPGHDGKGWTVKNLLELKNARRVLIQDNLLEHNWVQAQNGFAVLFTVRNQDGRAPWSVIEDVTFANNVVRHTASGINILGQDDVHPSQRVRRIAVRNNLFEDVGGPRWGGGGTLFQVLRGPSELVIEHNTALHTGNIVMVEGEPVRPFVFQNNIVVHNDYGVAGSGTAPGRNTLDAYFPGAVFRKNVIVGGAAGEHPRDNFFPRSLEAVGFVNRARRDYRLADRGPYKGAATDGTDIGIVGGGLRPASEPPASDRRAPAKPALASRWEPRRPPPGPPRNRSRRPSQRSNRGVAGEVGHCVD
jgi:hypothetical protein